MLNVNAMSGFGARPTAYTTGSVLFDGTNDYLNRGADLSGTADGTNVLISFWMNLKGGDSAASQIMWVYGGYLEVSRASSNKFTFSFYSTGASQIVYFSSSSTYVLAGGWLHVLASFKTTVSTAAHLYINDSDEYAATTLTAGTLDLTHSDWTIGKHGAAAPIIHADIADFYFAEEYLDISSVANRRKFIDAAGKPVNLGADGSTPTGTQPITYHHMDVGGTPANFGINLGSGGGMTVNGAFTAGTDNPSD